MERAWGSNFRRAFICSISLLLDLASPNLGPDFLRSCCISYFCEVFLQESKQAALLIKLLSYNHCISDVSAGLNNTRQRDFMKVKAKP